MFRQRFPTRRFLANLLISMTSVRVCLINTEFRVSSARCTRISWWNAASNEDAVSLCVAQSVTFYHTVSRSHRFITPSWAAAELTAFVLEKSLCTQESSDVAEVGFTQGRNDEGDEGDEGDKGWLELQVWTDIWSNYCCRSWPLGLDLKRK